ncbi:hypothetical protein [Vibrio sp. R78045]|uniref:hypothetical protein n=1 Tax=Vibrio sp. R78045 TaxID=3093868 RepID=UPI0036F2BCEE
MSLKEIRKQQILDDGIQSVEHKGFTVMISSVRGSAMEVTVMRMLEESSDAAHVLLLSSMCHSLEDVRAEVKDTVNDYSHTAKQIQALHDNGMDMTNQDNQFTAQQIIDKAA